LRQPNLAAQHVNDARRLLGIIKNQTLDEGKGLPHGRQQAPPPSSIQVTEPAVALTVKPSGELINRNRSASAD
jgi:hypothetical protein